MWRLSIKIVQTCTRQPWTILRPRRCCYWTSTFKSDEPRKTALNEWLESLNNVNIHESDVVHPQKVRQLAATIPFVTGTPQPLLTTGAPLPPAWHLIHFSPERSMETLGFDGTEKGILFPPEVVGPMERMWASGTMEWNRNNPIKIGDEIDCDTTLDKIQVKEGNRGPMIFIHQHRVISNASGPCLTEIRCHMYRRPTTMLPTPTPRSLHLSRNTTYTVPTDISETNILSHSYVPSMIHLFRFSALTFNSHRIHYDRQYCIESEFRPDCVVHGPLTALLLCETLRPRLETLQAEGDTAYMAKMTYRALSPLYVSRQVHFKSYKSSTQRSKDHQEETWPIWATDDQGTVAMGGEMLIVK